ncbi:cobalt ABC transporter permease [Clostridium perfringens]|nr:cobalt ABC transporter permease [Clostridium perfringens]PWX09693.1 cobalt ABC transporter permease [Clostridium perfringens]PWX13630.1 cobalt ABC transporter permease [Clostridium perfringens]PWX16528.1 cobalt ABC transporter permease [Clostridium perfringens]
MEKFLDPIFSALAAAIALFLATIIKSLGDQLIQLIKVKIEATDQKLKSSKFNEAYEVGKKIFFAIEEKYRITDNLENLVKSKADLFDKMLLEKFPYLNKEEIMQIRQSIAGEYNKGKTMLYEDSLKNQAEKLVDENNKLKLLNAETENKLAAVKSLNESL